MNLNTAITKVLTAILIPPMHVWAKQKWKDASGHQLSGGLCIATTERMVSGIDYYWALFYRDRHGGSLSYRTHVAEHMGRGRRNRKTRQSSPCGMFCDVCILSRGRDLEAYGIWNGWGFLTLRYSCLPNPYQKDPATWILLLACCFMDSLVTLAPTGTLLSLLSISVRQDLNGVYTVLNCIPSWISVR